MSVENDKFNIRNFIASLDKYQAASAKWLGQIDTSNGMNDIDKFKDVFNQHILNLVKTAYSNTKKNPSLDTVFSEISKIIQEIKIFKYDFK